MRSLVDADDTTETTADAAVASSSAWPTPTGPPVDAAAVGTGPAGTSPLDAGPLATAEADAPGLPGVTPAPPTSPEPQLTVATGPSAIFSDDVLAAEVPSRPVGSATLPPATPPPAAPLGRSYADFLAGNLPDATPTRGTGRGRRRTGGTRWLARLVVLALIGGIAAAGVVWGPDLYERWRPTDAAVEEPAAPLAFPDPSMPLAPIRTATFVIDGPGEPAGGDAPETVPASSVEAAPAPDAAPRTSYTVTIDFQSTTSRIVISRDGHTDLEVLTAFDDAVVRRVDRDVWYRVPRGELPVTEPADRLRWVRSLDELFPPTLRREVSITEASLTEVAGVPTRRLVARFDPTALGGLELGDPAAPSPTEAIAEAATGTAPPVTEPVAPAASAPLPPQTVELEIWVDDAGLVRQVTGDLLRGAETVTVLEVSDEAWLPTYPDPAQLQPLTAAALIDLGL